ncbi:peptidoglycan-binding domain-containing protein [Actinosynnema sp. CS-041913]|uniref:peptidoglycan-binding domain-containing protein n=1 Tax=Actinosynnema sp. CS-041913 TaxID=3239917 RepID=UPI003D8E72EB
MGEDQSRPDPAAVSTAADYVRALRALRTWSGCTYRQVEANARANGEVLPHTTVATALGRESLPRQELVVTFVRACGGDDDEVGRWVDARRRLAVGEVHEAAPVRAPSRLRKVFAVAATVGALTIALQSAGTAEGCAADLAMGDDGLCVKELQVALQRNGLALPADGRFGPYTKMRVVAFQQLSGLPPTGIADEPTRTALAGRRSIGSWTPEQVERRVREVFPEEPDRAVRLTDCLSRLDPLWIYGRPDRTRDWGLFQLNDREVLFDFRTDHTTALDPERNIQMAREVWRRTGDFRRWHCEQPVS